MSLDCGRKLEYPERAHADMGRASRLPHFEFEPGRFIL